MFCLSEESRVDVKTDWSYLCVLPCRPKEFIDCIAHVRLLSWLLLGSLTHAALCPPSFTNSGLISQPIPLDAGNHIADHIQVILAGFAEQSKASVLHMSSLFHAFILCQVWLHTRSHNQMSLCDFRFSVSCGLVGAIAWQCVSTQTLTLTPYLISSLVLWKLLFSANFYKH